MYLQTASFRWRINWPDRLDCGRRSPTFKLQLYLYIYRIDITIRLRIYVYNNDNDTPYICILSADYKIQCVVLITVITPHTAILISFLLLEEQDDKYRVLYFIPKGLRRCYIYIYIWFLYISYNILCIGQLTYERR